MISIFHKITPISSEFLHETVPRKIAFKIVFQGYYPAAGIWELNTWLYANDMILWNS
jgi:hypothetical protein